MKSEWVFSLNLEPVLQLQCWLYVKVQLDADCDHSGEPPHFVLTPHKNEGLPRGEVDHIAKLQHDFEVAVLHTQILPLKLCKVSLYTLVMMGLGD